MDNPGRVVLFIIAPACDCDRDCGVCRPGGGPASGWHKLCIKSQGKVINDNIKQTHSGQYELVAGEEQQPKFRSLPDMVTHYSKRQAGSPYMLAAEGADDAPYDMSDGVCDP